MDHFYSAPHTLRGLRKGPLAPYIDEFAMDLRRKGYARFTARYQIRLIGKLARWLEQREVDPGSLNRRSIDEFIMLLRRNGSIQNGYVGTLYRFLERLKEAGVIQAPPPETMNGPWEQEEHCFKQYLEHERGLASVTIKRYWLYVREFLTESLGQGGLHYSRLRPHHITDFILRYARRHQPGTAALMVTVLRSFLRYLHQRGALFTELAQCVPTVPNWRLTTLPKGLAPDQVKLVLQTCDRRTNVGCRNYAVLLLLARLGLRAGEVCLLTLDDFNWAAGELIINGKGTKRICLPLPSDVGKALVAYLKNARPECSSRRLFIRARAPLTGFANYSAVGTIVSRAILRTGIHAPYKGAHTLRHGIATLMLSNGASLEEIGKILRHKRPETTSIYAKVDLTALRGLAQPWPGGRS